MGSKKEPDPLAAFSPLFFSSQRAGQLGDLRGKLFFLLSVLLVPGLVTSLFGKADDVIFSDLATSG